MQLDRRTLSSHEQAQQTDMQIGGKQPAEQLMETEMAGFCWFSMDLIEIGGFGASSIRSSV